MTQQTKREEVLFSQGGHRRTVQRQMILRTLEEAEGHLTMEQLTKRVQSSYPSVSLSTFYRNVDLLIESGLLRANHLPGEGTTYELADEKPHVHLVCQRCQSVTHLTVRQLESLSAEVHVLVQFHVISLELNFRGYCTPCWDLLLSGERGKIEE